MPRIRTHEDEDIPASRHVEMPRIRTLKDETIPASQHVGDVGVIWGNAPEDLREHVAKLLRAIPGKMGSLRGKVWAPTSGVQIDPTASYLLYFVRVKLVDGPLSNHERLRYMSMLQYGGEDTV